jgi:RND family efflux transporter MFP subunit
MRNVFRILLPVLVLLVGGGIAFHTVANRPEPERRSRPVNLPEVDVRSLAPSSYQVVARTRGTVRPRTESTLIPEVNGRVVEVSPSLRSGEFFEAGEVLLSIDPRDYRSDVAIAEADLVQARAGLTEEQVRAEQAAREWKRLGESGEPDPLVLRKPQLASARAAVRIAQARLGRARLQLERTAIVAPYAGRVLEQNVDLGQYVSGGTVLARIYAVDYVEVRLPLTNRQLEFVDVPEIYRRDEAGKRQPGPRVRFEARVGQREHVWEGRVVRAEGSVDARSRQLFVVAQVADPYARGPRDRPPLKVGQFVEATVEGRTLEGVFVIPRGALRPGDQVLLIDEQRRIASRDVGVLWADEDSAVIGEGLATGDRLVLTPLGAGMEGVEVRVAGQGDGTAGEGPRRERRQDGAGRPDRGDRPAKGASS